MKIGVIARAEDRGLGILTWEAWRHLPNDPLAIVVDPGRFGQGFPQHPERYADFGGRVDLVRWNDNQTFDEAVIRDLLVGLDVLYSAETIYDPRVIGWAREMGVATVLHTMPELHKPAEADAVDVVWCPTPWRMDEIAARTDTPVRLVPVPVALERFRDLERPDPIGAPRVLHVAGHAAMADRNGTKLVAAASYEIAPPISVWVSSQDDNVALGPGAHRIPPTVDYWRLYELADILLMPRRFGGLCLPIQEAMAAGLAVVALDTSPHDWYGCGSIPAEPSGQFPTGSGEVTVFTADPSAIAAAVRETADRLVLAEEQERSRVWASEYSWDALRPVWMDELAWAVANRRDNSSTTCA